MVQIVTNRVCNINIRPQKVGSIRNPNSFEGNNLYLELQSLDIYYICKYKKPHIFHECRPHQVDSSHHVSTTYFSERIYFFGKVSISSLAR